MKSQGSRQEAFLLLYVLLHIACLAMPFIVVENGDFLRPDTTYSGAIFILLGWISMATGMFAWSANLIAALAVWLCQKNKSGRGFATALAAFVISLEALLLLPFPELGFLGQNEVRFGPGFYLWEAGLLSLVLYAYSSWQSTGGKWAIEEPGDAEDEPTIE